MLFALPVHGASGYQQTVSLDANILVSSAQKITVISRFNDEYEGCRLQFLRVD